MRGVTKEHDVALYNTGALHADSQHFHHLAKSLHSETASDLSLGGVATRIGDKEKMEKYFVVLVLVVVALMAVDARRRSHGGRGGRGQHTGCHRWPRENPRGSYFLWTVSSTQENGLLRTEEVEAFAPAGNLTVYKWSRIRGHRSMVPMGRGPIKILYDYSVSPPIVAYGVFARRRSLCVILAPDVDTYDDLVTSLNGLNVSNVQLTDSNDDVRVTVEAVEMSDTSGVSALARDMCQGHCGGRDVTYYSVQPDGDDDDDDDSTAAPEAEPVVVELVEEPVAVKGLPELVEFRRESRRLYRQELRRQGGRGRPDRRAGRGQDRGSDRRAMRHRN